MEKLQRICILCLNILNDGDFKVVGETVSEALDILLLKLDVNERNNALICDVCSKKLFAAYKFKIICMNTDDSIVSYVSSENVAPIDLREFYLKGKCEEYLKIDVNDEKICRICMQIGISGFATVNDIKADLIEKYIPEVNFNFTEDPVICSPCFDSLNNHGNFLLNCLDIEQQFKNTCSNEIPRSEFCITTEKIEIKEEIEEDSDISLHNDDEFANIYQYNSSSREFTEANHKSPSKAYKYKCNSCDYQCMNKNFLTRHEVIHKEISEVKMYKCDKCDFESKHRICIIRHQRSKHAEVRIYTCDTCSYTTKRKDTLTEHQLKHKNLPEEEMYKCDVCKYKTKRKRCLKVHQLKHKDISEIRTFDCHKCGYRAKQKRLLLNHQLKHDLHDDIKTEPIFKHDLPEDIKTGPKEKLKHKCDACDYKSNSKRNLTRHLLKHKNASEIKMYSCDVCNFKTKDKDYILVHQVRHEDLSELKVYTCDLCDYKTKRKTSLALHQLEHDDIKVQIYQCDDCDFQTKDKSLLKNHRVCKHNDGSQMQLYGCNVCSFKSKYRSSLVSHKLKHKQGSEVQMYQCDTCDFKSKYKNNLVCHQKKHKDVSEVHMYKCESCDYSNRHKTTFLRHLRKHLCAGSTELSSSGFLTLPEGTSE